MDYPVVLRVRDQPCLVVGGGPVAARRASGLLGVGAQVTLVAPVLSDAVDALVDRLTLERRPYRSGEAAGYRFVVTATGDPGVDGQVVADAAEAGVPVVGADAAVPGTVHLPAIVRDGRVTVAVSTGGTSPAIAVWLRERLARALPADLSTVVALVDEARTAMVAAGRPTESVTWSSLIDDRVLPLLAAGRPEQARRVLLEACLPPDHPGATAPG